jgi:DNA-binding IclR family transcriptional regulator
VLTLAPMVKYIVFRKLREIPARCEIELRRNAWAPRSLRRWERDIKKARERGTRFGRKPLLVSQTIQQVRKLRKAGKTVPEIMRQTDLSKASVYRALGADKASRAN